MNGMKKRNKAICCKQERIIKTTDNIKGKAQSNEGAPSQWDYSLQILVKGGTDWNVVMQLCPGMDSDCEIAVSDAGKMSESQMTRCKGLSELKLN